jgi:hypothetical protein
VKDEYIPDPTITSISLIDQSILNITLWGEMVMPASAQ